MITNNNKIKAKILVAEDDVAIAKIIQHNLMRDGYEVRVVSNGDYILDSAKAFMPDVILLDWMLPGMQGTKICSLIRFDKETANIPIIMISSKDSEADKVVGLVHGADDYITKPISPVELNARIKAMLRRLRPMLIERKLAYRDIEIDLNSYVVQVKGLSVKLSPIEFNILQILMEYPKKVFSREVLIERVWGERVDVDVRTIDVHITRLRKHLAKLGHDIIKTVRTMGYKIE